MLYLRLAGFILYSFLLFYAFSTLWSKNVVLRLKTSSRFCPEIVGI